MATKRFGDITRRAEAEVIARKREAMGKKEELRQEMQLRRREKRDARRAVWHERRERAMATLTRVKDGVADARRKVVYGAGAVSNVCATAKIMAGSPEYRAEIADYLADKTCDGIVALDDTCEKIHAEYTNREKALIDGAKNAWREHVEDPVNEFMADYGSAIKAGTALGVVVKGAIATAPIWAPVTVAAIPAAVTGIAAGAAVGVTGAALAGLGYGGYKLGKAAVTIGKETIEGAKQGMADLKVDASKFRKTAEGVVTQFGYALGAELEAQIANAKRRIETGEQEFTRVTAELDGMINAFPHAAKALGAEWLAGKLGEKATAASQKAETTQGIVRPALFEAEASLENGIRTRLLTLSDRYRAQAAEHRAKSIDLSNNVTALRASAMQMPTMIPVEQQVQVEERIQ